MFSEFARSVSSGEHIRRRELLHPDRADALTEGVVDRRLAADTSVMCRVPRLCLTPDQKSRSSGDGGFCSSDALCGHVVPAESVVSTGVSSECPTPGVSTGEFRATAHVSRRVRTLSAGLDFASV